jgi:hypothetical protein
MSEPRLRYASYHLHLVNLFTEPHRATPTFWEQAALVQALDQALDLLETDPVFRHLTVVGGSAVLEDYLRLRPEHFERLEAAVRRGALLINPFYTLPQPSAHTAEGLIRNLLRGTATAQVFGGAMPIALCLNTGFLDTYLPQVLRGFNIQAILTNAEPYSHPLQEQLWQGADGTQILWARIAKPHPLEESIANVRHRLAPHNLSGHLMLPYPWSAQGVARAGVASIRQALPQDIVLHSTPMAYAKAAQATINRENLPPYKGGYLFAEFFRGTQVFDGFWQLEGYLTECVEPLIAAAAIHGDSRLPKQPQRLVAQLWQPLFDQHAHYQHHQRQVDVAHLQSEQAAYLEMLKTLVGTLADSAPIRQAYLGEVVWADHDLFALKAAKLPDDPAREGLIVRGSLDSAESAWVTLTPCRRFAVCEVVSLAEVPSGGKLATESDGSFRFRAEPHHYYTFWLHD